MKLNQSANPEPAGSGYLKQPNSALTLHLNDGMLLSSPDIR